MTVAGFDDATVLLLTTLAYFVLLLRRCYDITQSGKTLT